MYYTELKGFSEIEFELLGLSRKEQYQKLLQTFEWNDFRNKIIERDNHCCLKCGKKEGLILEDIPFVEQMKKKEDGINSMIQMNEELLQTKMNNEERQKFIQRYGNIQVAKERVIGDVILNVHHKFYIWNNLPWKYDINDLETLCINCHIKTHSEEKILTYLNFLKEEFVEEKLCNKCEGKGYIQDYKHFQNGICFECWGCRIAFLENPKWIRIAK
ncbi:MAG TPA: hypothetical protein VKT28_00935 [Puia sp.]|nr:hypothetical protein [Puia sp.]